MPPVHAYDLVPDADGCARIESDWQALKEAGLPSQVDNTAISNLPHLTLVVAPVLTATEDEAAGRLLAPLVPLSASTAGLTVLGGSRVTIARLVEVPPELLRAVLDLRDAVPHPGHVGWLPHITLARRVPRREVARALDVLDKEELDLTFTRLRRWDPDSEIVTELA